MQGCVRPIKLELELKRALGGYIAYVDIRFLMTNHLQIPVEPHLNNQLYELLCVVSCFVSICSIVNKISYLAVPSFPSCPLNYQ
jgi:hypothetical protein